MNFKKKIILIWMLIYPLYAFAGMGTEGTTGMQFLNLGADARGSALSGAVFADVTGTRAIYYNPAGLNYLKNQELIASYTKWIADMNFVHLGFATTKLSSILFGNIGVGITFMDEGKISSIGIEDNGNYALNSSDIAIELAYAKKIAQINLGAGLKFLNRSVFGESSSGVAFDVGAQLNFKDSLNLGAVLKNIGFASAVVKESDLMPMKLGIGAAYGYNLKKNGHINGLIGADLRIDDLPVISLGLEYILKNMLFLRLSYSLATGGNRIDEYNGISFGLGIVSKKLSIDFSVIPMGILGTTFHVSLGINL